MSPIKGIDRLIIHANVGNRLRNWLKFLKYYSERVAELPLGLALGLLLLSVSIHLIRKVNSGSYIHIPGTGY